MSSINLREMDENDLEMVLEWRNNPEVRKNMYTQHVISMDEHRNWFQKIDNEDAKYLIFEIDGEPIGLINFTNLKKKPFQAMWGFYSGDLTRRGVGKAMELSALEYAFTELKLEKLNCEVLSSNIKVVNFHRKFGFRIEGKFNKHFQSEDNEVLDIYRLAIDRKTWKRAREDKSEFKVGQTHEEKIKITDELIQLFGEFSGDMNPIHFEDSEAKKMGFEKRIAHGMIPATLISKILGNDFPGKGTVYLSQNLEFKKPITANSEIKIQLKIVTKVDRKVTIETNVFNSNDEICTTGEAMVLLPKTK